MDKGSEAAPDDYADESDDALKDVLVAIQAFEGKLFLSKKNDRITEICGDGRVILQLVTQGHQANSHLWTNPEYMCPLLFHWYKTHRRFINDFSGQSISFATNISPPSQHPIPIYLS